MIFNICVEPKYLNENIEENVEDIVIKKYKNKCFSYGYIKDIFNIKIIDNYISSVNSNIIFKIECDIIKIYPDIDTIFEGIVKSINSQLIMVIVNDFISTTVSYKNLKENGFIFENNIFIDVNKNKKICIDDTITVKIKKKYFGSNRFYCSSSLVI